MNIEKHIKDVAAKYGFDINEKRLPVMEEKLQHQLKTYGDLYCPCQMQRNEDTICPCKYLRNNRACRCGLFKEVQQ